MTIKFSVSDSGVGIPDSALARIFEPFEQEDASITRRFGGTGLGLSISLQLVELMGGKLEASSRPNVGSCFFFNVSLPLISNEQISRDARAEPAPTNTSVKAKVLHVLVAEDNPVNQNLARRLIEKQGHKVTLVNNGQEALDALFAPKTEASVDFDLVLMDCQMPVMGGFEATQLIREKECGEGGHIPIVAMTANAMEGDRERCLGSGMDDYLAKPVDVKNLQRLLAQLAQSKGV